MKWKGYKITISQYNRTFNHKGDEGACIWRAGDQNECVLCHKEVSDDRINEWREEVLALGRIVKEFILATDTIPSIGWYVYDSDYDPSRVTGVEIGIDYIDVCMTLD